MTLPPIHRQIVVPASPEAAFQVFTDRIGTWWPVASFGVHGTGSTAAFQDDQLVETAPSGRSRSGARCSAGSRPARSG